VTDSHAHLDACAEPDAVVARAREAGVTRIVTIGTGIDSCRRALELAEAHDVVVAALGIDPHRAATGEAARVEELRPLLEHPRAVAVGETGLDGHHGADTLREQRVLLDAQLGLAESLALPIVIHSRAASEATAAALEPFGGTVILQCFSEPELFEPALERGYYVSFAGNATYPSAAPLRAAAARVPADRILVETDAPYLAPQPVRGRPNEPRNLGHTVRVLAESRGDAPDELAARTHANAAAAFGLSPP
jgi:TatD DNase family protein